MHVDLILQPRAWVGVSKKDEMLMVYGGRPEFRQRIINEAVDFMVGLVYVKKSLVFKVEWRV